MKRSITDELDIKYILQDITLDIYKIEEIKLNKNQVHIWLVNLKNETYWIEHQRSMLLKDELAQINKFKLKEDRIRGICGKVVAKILLSKYTGIRKDEISIQKGKYGKPYFNNKEHIQFNISHSEEYVILAFTKEEKVGIDIEKIREFNDYKDIARQFFCDFESRDVINTNSINHFFKYWTQKEAFVKATGEGLWRDLTSFGIKNNTVYLVRCNGKKFLLHGWNVHSFNIRGEYMVSIALKRK